MNNNTPKAKDLVIRPASFNDISYIQHIARQTWPVAYGEILSKKQLAYMLELLYSAQSLQKQIAENHHFLIALQRYNAVGFTSFSHVEKVRYKLQKLYVMPQTQKIGTGKKLLDTVEDLVINKGGEILELNVNRNNEARNFYERNGFTIVREDDIDIGKGYFMNDYIMEKQLGKSGQGML